MGLIYDRQNIHNREVARVKYSQEELLEEQSLASSLNNSLPRPLDLTDYQPVADRTAKKIRNQRIISENIAFGTHLHGYPVVGVNDARYKTYRLRHQEVKEAEEKYEKIVEGRSNLSTPLASYQKLLSLVGGQSIPEHAVNDFKHRTTIDLGYRNKAKKSKIDQFISEWSQSIPFSWIAEKAQ